MRWAADGSAVFFSQGPVVCGAAVDGAWARAVADASGRPDPRLPWHPRVRSYIVVVGPMTYFDVSPDGDRLVYATCAYREEAVAGGEQASAEMLRQSFLREGYDPRTTSAFVHGYELAAVGLDGGPVERLTRNMHFDNFPAWSPDGTRIAYLTGQSVRVAGLVTMTTVGHRQPFFTGGLLLGLHPPQWSPDGTRLAVVGTDDSEFRHAVFTVGAAGGGLQRLGRTISGPSWSPDGTRLAFVGATDDEGDGWGLLTIAADGTDVRRVPLAPDWAPHYAGGHVILTELSKFRDGWIPTLAWSPAGDQLLYTCGRRICVVGLDGTPVGRSPIEWWSGSVAAWSPRGVAWDARRFDATQPRPLGPALYTMAPDGTDVRVLAEFDAEGELRPKQLQAPPAIVAAARCQAGVAVADPTANRGLVQDCAALLRVQAVWAPPLNWSTDRPLSDWVGVASSGSPPRVRELDVSGRGLRGPIPAALGQVTHLRYLDLSHNQFSGPIPVELSQLADLRAVFLAGNQLTGCAPPGLPVVDREELGLPECEAAGPGDVTGCSTASVAPEPAANPGLVADCEALLAASEVLDPLGTLNWSADLPLAHWDGVKVAGTPPRVQGLNLSGRGLYGQFPPELSRLTHLRNLGLSRTNLEGPIPPELEALAQLESLYLAGNQLTGCLPLKLPVSDREELELPDCEAGA